jgi:two-component system, OmpR family, response regulator RstA
MDLVSTSARGYTVQVNHFLPHSPRWPPSPDDPARDPVCAPAAQTGAPRPDGTPHRVRVWSDDTEAAARWCAALHDEGLATDGGSSAGSDTALALVLHITRRLTDCLGLLRELRARGATRPVVVVCQQLRDLDHVLALEMGADDVLDAATAPAVVAARLRALARRLNQAASAHPGPDRLDFGALGLRLRERSVQLRGVDIGFTEGEFEVLWLLASQAGHAVSRAELLRRLRGLPYQRIDRSIDCRVYRIRAKLGDSDGPAQRIRTVRNCGYLFSPAPW